MGICHPVSPVLFRYLCSPHTPPTLENACFSLDACSHRSRRIGLPDVPVWSRLSQPNVVILPGRDHVKNQYVADINDYRKYGVIRTLSNNGSLRTGVCWMLTPDDNRTDGQFTRYVKTPQQWRQYDPQLFDHLACCLRDERRDIDRIESSGLLPNCAFHSELLTDLQVERLAYFAKMHEQFAGVELIFFDPDNGLEIKSLPLGRKRSSKFLYWHELIGAFLSGNSVLVYQHFIREKREEFISRLASEISSRLDDAQIFSFRTAHVVFFLASQPRHVNTFIERAAIVADQWAGQIKVHVHMNPV